MELSSKLLTPFETKVPIDDYFYKEWKKWAGNKLDDYFVNSDVLGLTGTRLSSKCQAVLGQTYHGSENALISRYDHLLRDIWDELHQVYIYSRLFVHLLVLLSKKYYY